MGQWWLKSSIIPNNGPLFVSWYSSPWHNVFICLFDMITISASNDFIFAACKCYLHIRPSDKLWHANCTTIHTWTVQYLQHNVCWSFRQGPSINNYHLRYGYFEFLNISETSMFTLVYSSNIGELWAMCLTYNCWWIWWMERYKYIILSHFSVSWANV